MFRVLDNRFNRVFNCSVIQNKVPKNGTINKMTEENALIIRVACERLVLDFARYADQGEYEKVAALFADTGTFTRRGETFHGSTEISDSIDALLKNRRSAPKNPWWRVRHFCSNIVIDVTSAKQAVGLSYYTIYRYQGDPVDGVPPVVGPALIGDYADVFVRTSIGWRFQSREVRPVFFNPAA